MTWFQVKMPSHFFFRTHILFSSSFSWEFPELPSKWLHVFIGLRVCVCVRKYILIIIGSDYLKTMPLYSNLSSNEHNDVKIMFFCHNKCMQHQENEINSTSNGCDCRPVILILINFYKCYALAFIIHVEHN